MEDRDYYKDVLAKMPPHSKYVSPYDTSEAPNLANMSVAPPFVTEKPLPPPEQPPPSPAANGNYGAGPADPHSPWYVPPPSINPVKVLNENNEQVAGISDDRDKHVADQAEAMADTAMNTQSGAQDKADVYTNQADALAQSNANDTAGQIQYQQDATKLAKEKQGVVDEMSDFYQRQPTDLWGRAGVNKVSGIIGLFLGAMSRDGHNPAMDALNTLVEQNLSQQKFNYEMLGNKAKMNDSLYARLRDKLGDDKSAELSARQVYTQEALARAQAVDNSMISKNAKSNLAGAIAELQTKSDDYKMQLQQHAFGQVSTAAQIMATTRGQDLAHAEHRENFDKQKDQEAPPGEVMGLDAPQNAAHRLSKAATDKVREQQQGIAKIGNTVDKMIVRLKRGGFDSDAARARLAADLKIDLIDAEGLSKRVGGTEGDLIAQKIGSLTIGLPGLIGAHVSPNTLIGMLNNLKTDSKNSFVAGLVANGYTVRKGGQYDDSSSASPTGQSDAEIIADTPTRGSKPGFSNQTGAAG